MQKRRVSRREFLRLSVVATAGAMVVACGSPNPEGTEEPEDETVATTVPTTASQEPEGEAVEATSESPMLAELVALGQLPPLEERLPTDPLVWDFPDVRVFRTERGEYGGTLRLGHYGDIEALATFGFVRTSADRTAWYPEVASSWEYSPDFKSITFQLQKGLKWSDGTPFTADDIMFWWEELIQSKYVDVPMGVEGMDVRRISSSKLTTSRSASTLQNPIRSSWIDRGASPVERWVSSGVAHLTMSSGFT